MEAQVPAQRGASGVLADRMAAALVHREPGWQLPRRSALARRYNVSMAEIDVAIGELARRSLIRRLPDGQLYRASPAEYLIPVEGIGGLSTSSIRWAARSAARPGTCRSATRRRTWPGRSAPLASVRSGSSGACGRSAPSRSRSRPPTCRGPDPDAVGRRPGVVPGHIAGATGLRRRRAATAHARAVDLELAPPQPSVARSLRLQPGQSAISVTIRFDDHATGSPVGLTTVTLKPDQFRVVIQAGDGLPTAPHLAD